jgi:hypothetical protein
VAIDERRFVLYGALGACLAAMRQKQIRSESAAFRRFPPNSE